jgi:Replication-relaxation
MSAGRVSGAAVRALVERLSDRDKLIVLNLHHIKFLTGSQIERLVFHSHSPNSQGHIRRRVLGRLTRLGIVATLQRRIGGVRAGSNGLVYCLDRFGQRLAELLDTDTVLDRTRSPYTPGMAFLNHTLAVSEAYVSLVELSRHRPFHLRRFLTEPACWRADGTGGWLRPDAFLLIENDSYEASWWLEIDQGTEHLGRIHTKLRAYERFVSGGNFDPGDLLPRVLFAAPDALRTAAIGREIEREGARTVTSEAVQQPAIAEHIYGQLVA